MHVMNIDTMGMPIRQHFAVPHQIRAIFLATQMLL